MASAHGHLNNEVMNNNRPPAPKFRKWLMRNNKSSLSGLSKTIDYCKYGASVTTTLGLLFSYTCAAMHNSYNFWETRGVARIKKMGGYKGTNARIYTAGNF